MIHWGVILAIFVSSLAYVFGGAFVLFKGRWSSGSLYALMALSAGLLLSIAILDLIPDTEKDLGNNSLFIMLGFLIMYGISLVSKRKTNASREKETLAGLSAGMLVHNFFEGLSIGMSYAVSMHLGVVVSLALIIHKIPEGLSYSSAVLALVRNRKKTALSLLIQGVSMWAGAGSAVFVSQIQHISEQGIAAILSVIAGIFLYLGGTSLLPGVNAKSYRRLPFFFIGGVVFYFVFHGLAEALS